MVKLDGKKGLNNYKKEIQGMRANIQNEQSVKNKKEKEDKEGREKAIKNLIPSITERKIWGVVLTTSGTVFIDIFLLKAKGNARQEFMEFYKNKTIGGMWNTENVEYIRPFPSLKLAKEAREDILKNNAYASK